jgi:CotH protein
MAIRYPLETFWSGRQPCYVHAMPAWRFRLGAVVAGLMVLGGCNADQTLGNVPPGTDAPADGAARDAGRPGEDVATPVADTGGFDSPPPADAGPPDNRSPGDSGSTPDAGIPADAAREPMVDAPVPPPDSGVDVRDAAPPDAADAGCGSADPGVGPPLAPSVLEPPPGPADWPASKLHVLGSPYSDPDGDAHAQTEFEIWLAPGGIASQRVWSATLFASRSALIADGVFDSPFLQLDLETGYAARMRYRDDRLGCSRWGEWSPWRVFQTNDQSQDLFDPDVIRTFEFTIPPASWDSINAECCPPIWDCWPPPFGLNQMYHRNYYKASLTVDGQVFDDIGLHIKGGCGSSRNLSQKAGFKANLMWDDPDVPGCPASRTLLGETHVTLNNEVQDATQTHDRMAHRLFRDAGVPAPRAVAAEVVVNGENWGPYVLVETVDRRFLKKWMPTNDGMMYEASPWCELNEDEVPPGLDDPSCFGREFDSRDPCDSPQPGEDPTDWELLRGMTQTLQTMPPGAFYPEIGTLYDYDEVLGEYAGEATLGHWDGYSFDLRNNYRVYHEPAVDLWSLLPWGTDQSFGTDVDPWSATGILTSRCLAEPECEALFADHLSGMADLFEWIDLHSQAVQIRAQIESLIAADPRKEYDMTQYDAANASTLAFIDGRPARIRQYLADHGF